MNIRVILSDTMVFGAQIIKDLKIKRMILVSRSKKEDYCFRRI